MLKVANGALQDGALTRATRHPSGWGQLFKRSTFDTIDGIFHLAGRVGLGCGDTGLWGERGWGKGQWTDGQGTGHGAFGAPRPGPQVGLLG